MSAAIPANPLIPPYAMPDMEHLVTEDDTPADMYTEKQRRLLTEPLYVCRPMKDRPFLATANVGLFYAIGQPPHVPDVLLSADVEAPQDLWPKQNRSYFVWTYGKPPDALIEVVSNNEGGEEDVKLRSYANIGVSYYAIWDPDEILGHGRLRVFGRSRTKYQPMDKAWFDDLGLGLTIWHGTFEGVEADWLRWSDSNGDIVPTGAELAERERQNAERQRQRAEQLAAQLKALGVEPKP